MPRVMLCRSGPRLGSSLLTADEASRHCRPLSEIALSPSSTLNSFCCLVSCKVPCVAVGLLDS